MLCLRGILLPVEQHFAVQAVKSCTCSSRLEEWPRGYWQSPALTRRGLLWHQDMSSYPGVVYCDSKSKGDHKQPYMVTLTRGSIVMCRSKNNTKVRHRLTGPGVDDLVMNPKDSSRCWWRCDMITKKSILSLFSFSQVCAIHLRIAWIQHSGRSILYSRLPDMDRLVRAVNKVAYHQRSSGTHSYVSWWCLWVVGYT